ncbi:MAG: ABC transporter ATP-binding protein [Candidatus Hydrothermarchaeota archaeon]
MAKISIENLTKVFRLDNSDLVVLKDLSLDVRDGEFLGIVGPSGCGKTTLLNIIAGLEEPTHGIVKINGKEIKGPGLDRGMLFQGYALLPWRTVMKNVELGLEIRRIKKRERERIAKYYIELVGLKGFEDVYPRDLSGGMMQRAALARALSTDPDVLLMDEPFASVDALTSENLQRELLRIWNRTKKTIIYVTHNIDEAIYLSDRVAVMSSRPARIKEIIDIELSRPRDEAKTNPKFPEIRQEIWDLLKKEVRDKETCLEGRSDEIRIFKKSFSNRK